MGGMWCLVRVTNRNNDPKAKERGREQRMHSLRAGQWALDGVVGKKKVKKGKEESRSKAKGSSTKVDP